MNLLKSLKEPAMMSEWCREQGLFNAKLINNIAIDLSMYSYVALNMKQPTSIFDDELSIVPWPIRLAHNSTVEVRRGVLSSFQNFPAECHDLMVITEYAGSSLKGLPQGTKTLKLLAADILDNFEHAPSTLRDVSVMFCGRLESLKGLPARLSSLNLDITSSRLTFEHMPSDVEHLELCFGNISRARQFASKVKYPKACRYIRLDQAINVRELMMIEGLKKLGTSPAPVGDVIMRELIRLVDETISPRKRYLGAQQILIEHDQEWRF